MSVRLRAGGSTSSHRIPPVETLRLDDELPRRLFRSPVLELFLLTTWTKLPLFRLTCVGFFFLKRKFKKSFQFLRRTLVPLRREMSALLLLHQDSRWWNWRQRHLLSVEKWKLAWLRQISHSLRWLHDHRVLIGWFLPRSRGEISLRPFRYSINLQRKEFFTIVTNIFIFGFNFWTLAITKASFEAFYQKSRMLVHMILKE